MKTSNLLFKSSYTSIIVFIIINLVAIHIMQAQQLAFPTAYGAGAYTTGGRGGTVMHVTNLNNSGEGSLREALTSNISPRYIVFDVSGTINLEDQIYMGPGSSGNFTVNGFSAPFGGITITGKAIRISEVDNQIWRGIRFRNGYLASESNSSSNWTCLGIRESSNVIVDRCSFAFAKSKGVSAFSSGPGEYAEKITIQNCLFGESQQAILVGNADGEEFGNVSVLRNVTSNVGWRHPKGGGAMQLDVINNLHHNWQGRTIRMDPYDYKLNVIGNYYQGGVITSIAENSDKKMFATWTNSVMSPQIWDEDNFITSENRPLNYPEQPEQGWYPFATSTEPIKAEWFVNNRLPLEGRALSILPSSDLKTELLPKVGACEYISDAGTIQFYRDSIDEELISLVENDTNSGYLDNSNYPLIAVNLPSNTRPNNFYISNPHIPEIWFQSNVPEGQDHNDLAPSGYTWLEEYLNQVDGPTISVESVVVTPNLAEIQIPETMTLTAAVTPSNATNRNGVWSSSDESIATVDQNGVVTPISNGVVTIIFTTTDGGFTDTSEITVFPEALQASAGDDQQLCSGSSTSLTATGGTNYAWSTGETTASIQVSPTETTTYSVEVSDEFGQSDVDSVVVTVNPLPNANAGDDQIICNGESVTLTASGGNEYLWNNGETTASITVSPDQETVYTVEVFSNSCSSTDSVTVNVNAAPILIISEDINIYNGNSTTLSVSGADTYQWSTGETTNSIIVAPSQTTTYSVSGFSGECQSTTQTTVTVIEAVNANAGEDISICSGESIELTASGGATYSWNTGETDGTITVSPLETTTYTVTVTDILGSSDTDSVTVTVNETPTVVVNENITIIEGESAVLTASGASTYLWSTGQTTENISVSPNTTTTYTVEGTTNTCTGQAEVTVIVEPEFFASAGQDQRVCEDSNYEVILTANQGDSYLWSTGETTQSITVSPLSTMNYTVTVFVGEQQDSDDVMVYVDPNPEVVISNSGDSIDILTGDFITLTASGANTYQWNNGATQPNIAVSPTNTTTYEVKGFIGDCYDEKEVTVNVYEPVEASAGENVMICPNETTTLTAQGGSDYIWSTGEETQSIEVSPSETTIYTVTVFNAVDFDEASVLVEVDFNCQNEFVEPDVESTDFSFEIFPNPAHNFINLKLSGTSISSEVQIFDLTGKLVKRALIHNEDLNLNTTADINVNSLQAGVYFLKVQDQDRNITKKLIVR